MGSEVQPAVAAEWVRSRSHGRSTPRQHEAVCAERGVAYRLLQGGCRLLLRLLTTYRVTGQHNYPEHGPYIVVFNHLHWLDIAVVFGTLRHVVATVVGAQWRQHPLVACLACGPGHGIFVQTNEVNPHSLAEALHWLGGGGVLLVAPEGTRSPTGLTRARRGTAYIAARTGVPIVPVAAWGQESAFAQLRRLRRPVIEVRIGAPVHLPGTPNHARGAELDAYTDTLMGAIATLLPAAYRGAYGAAPPPEEARLDAGRHHGEGPPATAAAVTTPCARRLAALAAVVLPGFVTAC